MAQIAFVIILDVISVFLAIRNFSDRPGCRWATHPFFILLWLPFVFFLIAGMATNWSSNSGFAMLFCIALAGPQGLLITAFVSRHLSELFSYGSRRGIVNLKTCDQAEAMEKRERFAEAEALFKEVLAGEEEQKDEKKVHLWAPVHLGYGNFLQRRGRLDEAVEEWRIAMRGNIPAGKYLVTAMRISDILLQKKKDRAAAEILRMAIEKYPKENDTRALRQRLQSLTPTTEPVA